MLFIERNLNFLKAGGRMAVVLPQGCFNNSSDKQIREFIARHCRILAVVGLHGNVFKPHTGTKTTPCVTTHHLRELRYCEQLTSEDWVIALRLLCVKAKLHCYRNNHRLNAP
ncbi:MAG: N-6 DNA methylase [Methylococcales bacterium]|nr:N-6 DNA methylase [Methylococcales bacterium]